MNHFNHFCFFLLILKYSDDDDDVNRNLFLVPSLDSSTFRQSLNFNNALIRVLMEKINFEIWGRLKTIPTDANKVEFWGKNKERFWFRETCGPKKLYKYSVATKKQNETLNLRFHGAWSLFCDSLFLFSCQRRRNHRE